MLPDGFCTRARDTEFRQQLMEGWNVIVALEGSRDGTQTAAGRLIE
jgi:hypothetical protein